MTISEKVAYLKGLAEGLDLDNSKSKEAKLISVMIGILEEIGMSIEDLEENTVALGEELDAVSDDLSDVEKAVFEDEDDDCCCDEDDDFFEVDCPNCGETLVIDESVLEEGVIQWPQLASRSSPWICPTSAAAAARTTMRTGTAAAAVKTTTTSKSRYKRLQRGGGRLPAVSLPTSRQPFFKIPCYFGEIRLDTARLGWYTIRRVQRQQVASAVIPAENAATTE